jgi:hypothetical protein
VPDDILRFFIRGFFDGNGSVGIYKDTSSNNFRRAAWRVFSTKHMLLGISRILNQFGVVATVKPHKAIYRLLVSGNIQILALMEWLYVGGGPFLARKRAVLDELRLVQATRVRVRATKAIYFGK